MSIESIQRRAFLRQSGLMSSVLAGCDAVCHESGGHR